MYIYFEIVQAIILPIANYLKIVENITNEKALEENLVKRL